MVRAVYHDPSVVSHWMEDIRASIRHGWKWVKNGFRLFVRNLSVSKRLLWKSAMGHPLTLREHKLLITTTSDLFKLVPFSLFIIIPFAELALPIALRLFPNMLPSTFMEKSFDSATVARRIRAKRELAEFFQSVIENRNQHEIERVARNTHSEDKLSSLQAFQDLIATETAEGVRPFPSVTQIVKLGKLFEDEFKLENMSLEQLQQICRMLGLQPYGFKSHVVLQLRHYVNRLRTEDRRISWEGVDSLTENELVETCHARGMPTIGVTEATMRTQLDHWLQLSSTKEVPMSLLLWSRTCFRLDERAPVAEAPEQPEELFEDTAERQRERADDLERRLEELEREVAEGNETAVVDASSPEIPDDRDELVEKLERMESELEIQSNVIERQSEVLGGVIQFLAKLQSQPWLVVTEKEQARQIRTEVNTAMETVSREIQSIDDMLRKSKHGEDHRFYPDSDDETK
jgi:LETM1 and EF-hand domain-containing protein 1, mitochondrial